MEPGTPLPSPFAPNVVDAHEPSSHDGPSGGYPSGLPSVVYFRRYHSKQMKPGNGTMGRR